MAIISREKIVEGLVDILGKERVITDEQVLKESSLDRYRKYEQVFEVYTQPIPAAVVYVTSTEEKLGKPVGSDADNDKTTYVTLVGADRAQQDVKTLTDKAVEILDSFGENDFMKTLSEYLVNREK